MLKKVIYYLILIPFSVFSQELDLFNEIETDELTESKLLPNKMIFTHLHSPSFAFDILLHSFFSLAIITVIFTYLQENGLEIQIY